MNEARGCWAVVPVKELAHAKTRLSPECPPSVRIALARVMLEDVLRSLAEVHALAGIAIVTADAYAVKLADRYDAQVFSDGARDGHTGAVRAAAQRLERQGCGTMLTLPGDIPAVTSAEIERVLRRHAEGPSFTICPAHDRRGSNAIVMSPPCAISLAFGNDSFLPHLEAARGHGIEPTIVLDVPGIARDVDHFADLMALQSLPGARLTKAVLEQYALHKAA